MGPEVVRRVTGSARSAPYIGGALMTAGGVIYSFVGHRNVSFRAR